MIFPLSGDARGRSTPAKMRFGEQFSGQRSEAAKTVRYEHAILLSAPLHHCAQFSRYVKAASSHWLHKSARGGLMSFGGVAISPDVRILSGSATTKMPEFMIGTLVSEKEKTGVSLRRSTFCISGLTRRGRGRCGPPSWSQTEPELGSQVPPKASHQRAPRAEVPS